jgi:hypothetical protein
MYFLKTSPDQNNILKYSRVCRFSSVSNDFHCSLSETALNVEFVYIVYLGMIMDNHFDLRLGTSLDGSFHAVMARFKPKVVCYLYCIRRQITCIFFLGCTNFKKSRGCIMGRTR